MPSPPDPLPPRPGPPRPPAPRPMPPRRDYAAEEEAGRRLTNAHIQLRRGLTSEADAAVRALLAERPGDAGAWELSGDIQASRGDWAAACAAYQTALQAQPGRASAEAKFGKATLRQAEQARQEKLGVAYAAQDTSLVGSGGSEAGQRGRGWALAGSAICPGLGQIVGGDYVKGGILAAIYVLCLLLLAHLPHGPGGRTYFGPAFWVVAALMTADWLYAVADAARAEKKAPNKKAPEKDGWQV